jgi:large subunit ribosomal protein L9
MAKQRSHQAMKGPRGGIELLLTKKVEGLGNPGDVVEVKAGYARNYLLPHGLATRASQHNVRMVEMHKRKLVELAQKRREDLEKLSRDLAKHSVSIEANANPEGHLYGSVGAEEITQVLLKDKFVVDPSMIKLVGPLKELGLYGVKIQLAEDLETEVKVWVVPATGSAAKKPNPE